MNRGKKRSGGERFLVELIWYMNLFFIFFCRAKLVIVLIVQW